MSCVTAVAAGVAIAVVTAVAGGDAGCVGDCCMTRLGCSAGWFKMGDGRDDAAGGTDEASAVSGTPIITPNGSDSRCHRKK